MIENAEEAAQARAESSELDFKSRFDPSSPQDYCEVVKDIVALANSGGGFVVIGVDDTGSVTSDDITPFLSLDPAKLLDKIYKYTEHHLLGVSIHTSIRDGRRVGVMQVPPSHVPIPFTKPGTYSVGAKQKTAFSRGTVYFRHGAKSEPASMDDLRESVERELDRHRHDWLDGIQRVVAAPAGSLVKVLPPEVKLDSSPEATPIRLTHKADAPVFRAEQADELYPHRQKELVERVKQLTGQSGVTGHTILCVRRVHSLDDDPTHIYKGRWSPRQYSEACAEWIASQFRSDPRFFDRAKDEYRILQQRQRSAKA